MTKNFRCYSPLSGTSDSNSLDHNVYACHNAYKNEDQNIDLSYVQLYHNVGISILFINFIDLTNLVVSRLRKFLNINRLRMVFLLLQIFTTQVQKL